jgi:hypothetical protein
MKGFLFAACFCLIAASASAQERRGRDVPPGHLPPPGECRVWYRDRPAGHQPPPTTCRQAERIARRDGARVIYGSDRDDRWTDRDDRRRDEGRDRSDRDRDDRDRDRDRDDREADEREAPRRRWPF